MQTSTAKKHVYVHRCEHLYPMYMDEYNEKLLRSFANVASGGDSTVALSYAEQVEQLRGAEIILSNCGLGAKEITYEALREAGTVKLIVVGHSWNQFTQLDLASLGIRLVEGSNRNTVSVAEWVLTASLMGIRRLHDFDRRLKAGEEWCEPGRETYSGMLKGRRVGLIGFGRIGRYVSRLFDAFGARVLVHDDMVSDEILAGYPVERYPLEKLLSECDIVSLHLAIAPATTGFMDADKFAMLKDGAIFLNCSRAVICDEAAMVAEFRKNRFSAYVDVFSTEPLPKDSPLRTLENVNISPHVAGYSIDMFAGCAREAIETIRRYCESGEIIDRKYE